jgi:hypothetical protein
VLSKNTETRTIVIDNFHYFSQEVQKELATAIRSFETYGFKFVVIGTWSQSGYLQNFNNDLGSTVREFSFENWSDSELKAVLVKGLDLLGVTLSNSVQQSLVRRSLSNIALLQDLTKDYLQSQGVKERCQPWRTISGVDGVAEVASRREDKEFGDVVKRLRPITVIGNSYVDGRSRSYWMLYAFLTGEHSDIVSGMDQDKLFELTCQLSRNRAAECRETVPPFTMSEFMGLLRHHWHSEQIKSNATPVLAYHEVNRRLIIVDAYTKFVLRTVDLRTKMRSELYTPSSNEN